jgi:hypothetical protein
MRKLALASVVLMVATLTACGGSSKSDNTASSDTSSSDKSSSDTSSTTSSDNSGNGSNSGSTYCTELRGARDKFKTLNVTGIDKDQFKTVTDEFDKLAAIAPDEVKADWTTVSDGLKQVYQILANAGLSFDDLQKLGSGHLPKGVSPQDLAKVGKQLQQALSGTKFKAAASHITTEAKTECGVNLGG